MRDKVPTHTTSACQYYTLVSCRHETECAWEAQRPGVQLWHRDVQVTSPWSSHILHSRFPQTGNADGTTLKPCCWTTGALYTVSLCLTHSGCSTNVWMCSVGQPFPLSHNFLGAGEENSRSAPVRTTPHCLGTHDMGLLKSGQVLMPRV